MRQSLLYIHAYIVQESMYNFIRAARDSEMVNSYRHISGRGVCEHWQR